MIPAVMPTYGRKDVVFERGEGSYLYAADLAIWLWTILFAGASGRPYNVGSAAALSITETAEAVRRALGRSNPIVIAQKTVPGRLPARYVPDTARARQELGLEEWIGLEEGIRRAAHWSEMEGKTG